MPDISKINALAIGSVAKVDGLAKASILAIDGVTINAPAAAYSVRLLGSAVGISSYTGDCMRVRRASDNVEADVGFDAGELKLTSPISNTSDALSYTDFADFVDHTGTPTDAFVRYWYDQSGNANDAGESTAGSQPQIYDATTGFIKEGSVGNEKPAVQFDGVNDTLQVSVSFSHAGHTYAVGSGEASGIEFAVCMGGASGERFEIVFDQRTDKRHTIVADVSTFTLNLDSQATVGQQYLKNNSNDSGTIRGYVDGVEQSATITGYSALSINAVRLAHFPAGGGLAYGQIKLQEAIIFNVAGHSNRTGIESDINGFFSIY